MYIAKIFGYDGYIELNAFTIGTIAVGAISGAYSTEVIRGAVNSVHKGQFEAGKTLGLNGYGLYGRVIFHRSQELLFLVLECLANHTQRYGTN